MIKSISSGFRRRVGLRKLFSKEYLDRWILLLVIPGGSFLPWVTFPLSRGKSPFNLHSPVLLSWGLLFLLTAILTIIGIKWSRWFLFLLLVIVLSFPLQIHWDYIFVNSISSEIGQFKDIRQFANKNLYESNFLSLPEELRPSDISDIWVDPWLRVLVTAESLGIGFWIVLIGTVIVSRKLGRRKFIMALLFSIILSLPGIATASFLTLGRDAFIRGNYSKSVNVYKRAMSINQSFGNRTLKKLELYYLWVGESLFHLGVKDTPEVYLFLGKNLEGVDSFVKSKEMYERAMSLPPVKQSLAKALVKEALYDFKEKEFGSAMERLEEAIKLDRTQIEAPFYMTYISFVLKNQQLTLYYAGLVLDRCKEKLLVSDLYNILGDMYEKTEDPADARAMYRQSISTFDRVKNGNYHAWVGIAGW